MGVYIEVCVCVCVGWGGGGGGGGVNERSCSINGIKCLLNGRIKKKCKI